MIEGFSLPKATFRTRAFDEAKMEYYWLDKTTDDYFKGKRVVLFSLPGAFTPTCSNYQLPGFEENYDAIRNQEVDAIYCCSVNDAYVMNAWAKEQKIENIQMIPDGSGNFTRFMGMLIGKNHLGFGMRSWRYMAIINDGVVEKWWQEPGINNEGTDDDPYVESTPDNMIDYLKVAHETGSYGDYSGIDHNKA